MNQDHPIHPHIAGLYRGFNSKVLLDARRLANFGLHASMWPYPFAGAELSVHRTVLLRVPDPLKGDVDLAQQLTFGMGREARTFARSLLAGVATFMDNLLTEFEEASLNRWTPKVYTQADVDPP